jgi:hypothetical protein
MFIDLALLTWLLPLSFQQGGPTESMIKIKDKGIFTVLLPEKEWRLLGGTP